MLHNGDGDGDECINGQKLGFVCLRFENLKLGRLAARRSATNTKLQSVLPEGARPARLMHKSKMAQSTRRRKEHEMVAVSTHCPVLT